MSSIVDKMMVEACRYPVLTVAEEVDLAARKNAGDRDALDLLIVSNLRLVVKMAYRTCKNDNVIDDVVAGGIMGLIRAAELFDPAKGAKFSWYAKDLIAAGMSRENWRQSALIVPWTTAQATVTAKYADDIDGGGMFKGRERSTLRAALQAMYATSLDCPRGQIGGESVRGAGGMRHELIEDPRGSLPIDEFENADEIEYILRELDNVCTKREARIIKLYYLGEKPLETIGGIVGLTRERVRQIKEEGLGKLRKRLTGCKERPLIIRKSITHAAISIGDRVKSRIKPKRSDIYPEGVVVAFTTRDGYDAVTIKRDGGESATCLAHNLEVIHAVA